jgi:hypothetical protein
MSNWSTLEHITQHLQRPRFGDSKHPTLWPSEGSAIIKNEYDEDIVVGKCRRAAYFRYAVDNYKFYEKYKYLKPLVENIGLKYQKPEPYTYWIWKAGDLYEEYCIQAAKESGIYISDQVPIYLKEHNISGKIDLQVINPNSCKYRLCEVKSVYGFGANYVLGTQTRWNNQSLGTPRDSNLIQIALYHFHRAMNDSQFEASSLLYGARDTGRFAEYSVVTQLDEDGTTYIYYKGIAPFETPTVKSPITIDSILNDGYKYIVDHLLSSRIPCRDYEIKYSPEKIALLYERGKLNKTETTQIDKIKKRKEDNIERIAEGKKPLKELKSVQKDDWQCRFCNYKQVCYDKNNQPLDL